MSSLRHFLKHKTDKILVMTSEGVYKRPKNNIACKFLKLKLMKECLDSHSGWIIKLALGSFHCFFEDFQQFGEFQQQFISFVCVCQLVLVQECFKNKLLSPTSELVLVRRLESRVIVRIWWHASSKNTSVPDQACKNFWIDIGSENLIFS